jgi:EpsI family protein
MRLRFSWIFLALSIALVWGAHALRPQVHLSQKLGGLVLDKAIPKVLGGWRVVDVGNIQIESPDQKTLIRTLYDQNLTRTYANARGDLVMLSIAYGLDQRDGKSAHRPEVCYPAQGFNILGKSNTYYQVAEFELPVTVMTAVNIERHEQIAYWLMVGDQPVTWGRSRGLVNFQYGLKGLIADGLVFRVSMIHEDPVFAQNVLRQFVTDLFAPLTPQDRRRLFGV